MTEQQGLFLLVAFLGVAVTAFMMGAENAFLGEYEALWPERNRVGREVPARRPWKSTQ